jgi:hypothetical protein
MDNKAYLSEGTDFNKSIELAKGLQNSNVPEIQEVCKAFLHLVTIYHDLRKQYVAQSATLIMKEHSKLLEKLAD